MNDVIRTSDLNNDGHGWVRPRADGAVAKCGGPAICSVCKAEQAAFTSNLNDGWLPCPFCGSSLVAEALWPGHRGCTDPDCGGYMANLPKEKWNRRPTIETFPVAPPQRYRVQQDKGEYALKGCADGDLVDYSAYEALLRRFNQPHELKASEPSPNDALCWICPRCTTVNGIEDEVCVCRGRRPSQGKFDER